MNFLGHFYLSMHDEELLIGNFIADFVKGKKYVEYPDKIAHGILMHREIDSFTDSHECVRSSKKRLWDGYRHYSSVLIDVYYDHYLANQWNKYHHSSLAAFAEWVYGTIYAYKEVIPPMAQYVYGYMSKHNWLVRYAELNGIDSTLKGMSKRTKYASGLEKGVEDLKKHYNDFQDEFNSFFASAIEHFNQV